MITHRGKQAPDRETRCWPWLSRGAWDGLRTLLPQSPPQRQQHPRRAARPARRPHGTLPLRSPAERPAQQRPPKLSSDPEEHGQRFSSSPQPPALLTVPAVCLQSLYLQFRCHHGAKTQAGLRLQVGWSTVQVLLPSSSTRGKAPSPLRDGPA